MTLLLDAAWLLEKALSWVALAVALGGVGTFGWYFIRINAKAARGGESESIPAESWRGRGALNGLFLFGAGGILALASMVFAALLPGRY